MTSPRPSNDLGKRAERAEAALAEALAERNRLWEELQHRAAQEREVEYLRTLNAQLEGSLSWRITAPLRSGKQLAGRARHLSGRARAVLRSAKLR